MYRSVTDSEQSQQESKKALRWIKGIVLGMTVFLLILFAFAWFALPPAS